MRSNRSHTSAPQESATRLLAVVDWTLDPAAVTADLSSHATTRQARIGLLVPAWLHSLDWIGDPTASIPCAERQLTALQRLTRLAGIAIDAARVGDPDLGAATEDVVYDWPADEVRLYARKSRLRAPRPFDPVSRISRVSGLPVTRVALPASEPAARNRRGLARRRTGRCTPPQAQLAAVGR
jgi:hypothetical protein